MSHKLGILSILVFISAVSASYFLKQSNIRKALQEDPAFAIVSTMQDLKADAKEMTSRFIDSEHTIEDWLQIEEFSEQRNNSLQIYSPEGKNFQTHSVEGNKVCNNFILHGHEVNHCIQIADENGALNPWLSKNGNLLATYKIAPPELEEYQIILSGDQFSFQKLVPPHKTSAILLLFQILGLLALCVLPFSMSFNKINALYFIGPGALLLGMESMYSASSCHGIYLMESMILVFFTMWIWRNYQYTPIHKLEVRLPFSIGTLLLTYALSLHRISSREFLIDWADPFRNIEEVTLENLSYILSGLILFFAFFVGLHQFRLAIGTKFKKQLNGYLAFYSLVLPLTLITYALVPNANLVPIVLSSSLMLVLTDFFCERRQNPAIWIVLWSVLFSLILSGLIFQSGFQQVIKKIKQEMVLQDSNAQSNKVIDELKIHPNNGTTQKETHFVEYNRDHVKISKFTDVGEVSVNRQLPSFIKLTSLFSIVFICCVFLYLFLYLLHRKIHIFPRSLQQSSLTVSSFSRKIQLSFLILTVISFLGIAFTTILILNRQFSKNKDQLLKSELRSAKNQVAQIYHILKDHPSTLNQELQALQKERSIEITLYNKYGKASSDEHMFVSSSIINYLNNHPRGSLSTSLLDGDYKSFIHLENASFPYAKIVGNSHISKTSLSIADFILGILNVYVFLFIIAVAFALFIGKSIADPLSKLSQRMQRLRLGKNNELIEWQGEDEIANLIQKYNEMVVQLEDSAKLIAHTERDMAWREMARQVAHEIKNPLTPMKLNIQYLQKQMNKGILPDKEKLDMFTAGLLQQIQNLSNISEEFSNVAKLPVARNEKVILNSIVESVHDLFRKREDMDIHLSVPINDIFVFADQNQLTRVLNNILKNAIEAIPDERRGLIDMKLYKQEGAAIIQISDNGTGIPKHMLNKVFTPKFTTKNSGSGLGLPIAANMVESFNGEIYFTTNENEGTEFFIKLPLMKLESNMINKRVALD